jgi:hypothetical protein
MSPFQGSLTWEGIYCTFQLLLTWENSSEYWFQLHLHSVTFSNVYVSPNVTLCTAKEHESELPGLTRRKATAPNIQSLPHAGSSERHDSWAHLQTLAHTFVKLNMHCVSQSITILSAIKRHFAIHPKYLSQQTFGNGRREYLNTT